MFCLPLLSLEIRDHHVNKFKLAFSRQEAMWETKRHPSWQPNNCQIDERHMSANQMI